MTANSMSKGMSICVLLGIFLIIGTIFADATNISSEPLLDKFAEFSLSFQSPAEAQQEEVSQEELSQHEVAQEEGEPEEVEQQEKKAELPLGREMTEVFTSASIHLPALTIQTSVLDKEQIAPAEQPNKPAQPDEPKVNEPETNELKANKLEQNEPDLMEELLLQEEFTAQDFENGTLDFLQKIFEKTQEPEIMNAILQEFIDTYQFLSAKQFIEKLTPQLLREVDVHLYLQSAFNSFSLSDTKSAQTLQTLVDGQYQSAKLTKEEYDWYSGLISLMKKEYTTFFQQAKSFTQAPFTSFASKLQTLQTQITNQSDMPSYYFDALVAMELFNQGYFQSAKVLALSALQQNKHYILPYQILAYANFLTNSWDAAIDYLTTLSSLEPALQQKYDFLIGVASYRNKKYAESVLKLSQVKNEAYRLDAERYLALDYATLKQHSKLLSSREKLLGYNTLKKSDFYSYFYQVLFAPYAKGTEYTLYRQNPTLTQKYLSRCSELFSGKDSVICNYGKIGYQLVSGTTDTQGFEEKLVKLAENYPQSYLFHALGEWYLMQENPTSAKPYLIKAITMATSSEEAFQLKALLQQTM